MPPSVIPPEQLEEWLEKLRLKGYKPKAQEWCQNMGAISVQEVLENWQDFANHCSLKPLERKRVERDAAATGGQPAPTPDLPAANREAPLPPSVPNSPTTPAAGSSCFGPPEQPNRYALGEELGTGATATVYRCTRTSDGTQYGVKCINLGKLRLQPNFKKVSSKLMREVSILFTLRHPRIVSLFDVVEANDTLHLVMELVQGGELFDEIVRVGAFTEPAARYVFIQIAEGLKYIHSQDIVYRDLKPENILVDQKNSRRGLLEIKLSDFGHSKLINDGYSTALTRVGTPQYWAPEVSDPAKAAQGYSQRVDLWSLGVVLYVMLVGAYPFDGLKEPIDQQIKRAAVSFPADRPISQNAKDLIQALIKPRPENRLSLDGCLSHDWISSENSSLAKIAKLCAMGQYAATEEKLPLPAEPDKAKVEQIRIDLQNWTRKFRCAATLKYGEVVVKTQVGLAEEDRKKAIAKLHKVIDYHYPGQGVAPSTSAGPGAKLPTVPEEPRSFRYSEHTLKVSNDGGAGLELNPESCGMKILHIYEKPGQPTLLVGDLITKIGGQTLRGGPDKVVEIFGSNFRDGALLTIKRVSGGTTM